MNADDELKIHFNQYFKINEPKNIVYHYTSFSNLEKILRSRILWLTDYRYLNDSSEIKYSREVILNLVDRIIPTLSQHQLWERFYRDLTLLPLIHTFYVFSTCEREDYLPAWRAYANNGTGFSIGIAPDFFSPPPENIPNQDIEYRNSAKVHYETVETEEYLRQLFSIVQNHFFPGQERDLSITTIPYLLAIYPLLKHPAYREELEYRLFQIEESKEEFDMRNIPRTLAVPDKNRIWSPDIKSEFPFVNSTPRIITPEFDTKHIKEIWIGPRCNKEHARTEIQIILDELGYDETEIISSSIP